MYVHITSHMKLSIDIQELEQRCDMIATTSFFRSFIARLLLDVLFLACGRIVLSTYTDYIGHRDVKDESGWVWIRDRQMKTTINWQ